MLVHDRNSTSSDNSRGDKVDCSVAYSSSLVVLRSECSF